MPITWTRPAVQGAPTFAEIDRAIVGFVTTTAFPDGRWRAEVLPHGPGVEGLTGYAGTEARAKSFVEAWLKHHAPDTTGWRKIGDPTRRDRLPPRKPKGSDDRS
jgi:hypothetical protein